MEQNLSRVFFALDLRLQLSLSVRTRQLMCTLHMTVVERVQTRWVTDARVTHDWRERRVTKRNRSFYSFDFVVRQSPIERTATHKPVNENNHSSTV
jgi:hypothetical protein